MVPRHIHSEPTSRLAIWARRIAGFALLASILAILIVRSGLLEIWPALATFAGALGIAVVALLVAFAAFVVIWMEGLAGMGAALTAMAL
jgi:small-conductance mechanosensitive channel